MSVNPTRILLLLLLAVPVVEAEVEAAEAEAKSYPSWTMLLLARMMSNHPRALHPHPLRSPLTLWSGYSRVLLPSQASKRRKDKKDNKLADDEEEMMVAFLEANEMLWDKKATLTGDPISKPLHGRSRLKKNGEVAHLQGWFKGMRDNFARLDKLPTSGSGQRVFQERELWTLQDMNFLQKITYHKPEPVSSVRIGLQLHRRRSVPSIAGSDAISCRQ